MSTLTQSMSGYELREAYKLLSKNQLIEFLIDKTLEIRELRGVRIPLSAISIYIYEI